MRVIETELPAVLVVEPTVFGDARGWFTETYNQARYTAAGIALPFVQDNLSRSRRGILRGLHLQQPNAQGKLVWVPEGSVFDVAVDVRVGSPTFGRWVGVELSGDNHRQLWIPPGFAHGFQVTSEHCLFAYKCTDAYVPECEIGLAWDDPSIGVRWPVPEPILSPKDQSNGRLDELDRARLPRYVAVRSAGRGGGA